MKRIACLPGSFDPITLGHIRLARRVAQIFGSCRVIVMDNRDKTYLLSHKERYQLCLEAFREDENITVSQSEGMLYQYLRDLGEESVLVKGARDGKDFLYEKEMAEFNRKMCGVETLFLPADGETEHISSTLAREKLSKGEDLSSILPENVVKYLRTKL